MRSILYTTTKQDVWAKDLNDLMDCLRVFWMPYKFEVEERDDAFDIVVLADHLDTEEHDEHKFHTLTNLMLISMRMWIEGHSIGRFK